MTRKRCGQCGAYKPLDHFYQARGRPGDGLYSYCKPCHREVMRAQYAHRKESEAE